MEELIAAVVGAIVGAGIAGTVAHVQQRVAIKAGREDERARERRLLAREVMRKRMSQQDITGPLNEIPLVFGDDSDTLKLYGEMLDAQDEKARAEALAGLVNRIATLTGLPATVGPDEIERGFVYSG